MPSTRPAVAIQVADLKDTRDAAAYRHLLDAYARDPMGAGAALPAAVLRRVTGDLAEHPGACILLARDVETACGFATCLLGYSTFRARPLLNIHDLSVLPEYRGYGIGSRLLDAIEARARELGCCKLTLEVREDNPVADRLYRHKGFQAARGENGPIQYYFKEKSL